jgi:succinyl-CoA synthetase alpha subunit
MSILVDENTKVICQGITGKHGSFHCREMLKYGTKLVGGVRPGKGGTFFENQVPIFDSVREAVKETGATASIIFVPADGCEEAIFECIENQLDLVVCITEGIKINDLREIKRELNRQTKTRMIGPNCPGIITPPKCKIGIMPGYIHKKGSIGVISRSGTLTYEAVWQITNSGFGQSTCIGIGGDPIIGSDFISLLKEFQKDDQTRAVLIIGEIGGTMEEETADFIRNGGFTKKVFVFIAGQTAPKGKRMGHAGAIIEGGVGTAQQKLEKFQQAHAIIIPSPDKIGETIKNNLS